MSRITKKPGGVEENLIFKYLEENASDELVEKINNGKNEFKDCWSYIRSQAKAMANEGCAMIEDFIVYGWAVHFFEEDGNVTEAPEIKKPEIIKAETKKPEIKKPEVKAVAKPKKDDEIEGQMNLFEYLGGLV